MISYSQIGQDLWVSYMLGHKRNGSFVEIGAANGIEISNTYLLEKDYSWSGLCVEPSRQYDSLKMNRRCITDNSLIYKQSGLKVDFLEDIKNGEHNWFSGIVQNMGSHEVHGHIRPMITKSMHDLLVEYNFSEQIDYLSIDTEGSEYEILKDFPFSEWKIDLITVEHNYVEEARSSIYKLLNENGFILEESIETLQDDWYYHDRLTEWRNFSFDIVKFNSQRILSAYNRVFQLEWELNQLRKDIKGE